MYGKLKIYVTGERFTPESVEFGDAEERGWVKEVGSSEIFENRNDVAPIVDEWFNTDGIPTGEEIDGEPVYSYYRNHDDAPGYIRDALESLGSYFTEGNGTYYGDDAHVLDYAKGEDFRYALHAHVKHQDASGEWVETPVDVRDYL